MKTFAHWSAEYVGRPWSADGEGPEAFSCWGLVRAVMRDQFGVDVPIVELEGAGAACKLRQDTVAAIKHAARAGGWSRVDSSNLQRPIEGDIVLMQSTISTHVGVVVFYRHRPNVLHSNHGAGVVREEWLDAIEGIIPELWRRS